MLVESVALSHVGVTQTKSEKLVIHYNNEMTERAVLAYLCRATKAGYTARYPCAVRSGREGKAGSVAVPSERCERVRVKTGRSAG